LEFNPNGVVAGGVAGVTQPRWDWPEGAERLTLPMNRSTELLTGSMEIPTGNEPIRRSALRRVQRLVENLGLPLAIDGDKSPLESADKSAHSKACAWSQHCY
jgi:hypothetical protein